MKTGAIKGVTIAMLAALAVATGSAVAQSVGKWESISVRDLIAAGGIKLDQRVQLIGYVGTVDMKNPIYADKYVLQGYQGQSIPVVFTADRPLPPESIIVRGIFACNDAGQFQIIESRRSTTDRAEVTRLIQGGIVGAIDALATKHFEGGTPAEKEEGKDDPVPPVPPKPTDERSIWKYVAIGVVGILVIAVIIILAIVLSRPSRAPSPMVTEPMPAPPLDAGGGLAAPSAVVDDAEKTIVRRDGRVEEDTEKTLVRAPGALEIVSGGRAGTTINLSRPSSIIGRDHSNPPRQGHFIALDMAGRSDEEKRSLSRQQCRISYEVNNDEFSIENVASSGTTIWVNGSKLSFKDSAPLGNGDTVELEPDWKFTFKTAQRG
jgi:hypothetical protein